MEKIYEESNVSMPSDGYGKQKDFSDNKRNDTAEQPFCGNP